MNKEFVRKIKQEAHGPYRSPEKTVQINKHITFDSEKKKQEMRKPHLARFFNVIIQDIAVHGTND